MESPAPQSTRSPNASDPSAPANLRRRRIGIWLSALTIVLGVAALLLSLLPPVIYDEPFRWPWEPEEKKAAPEDQGGVTIKTKRLRFTFGANKPTQPAAIEPPISPLKPFRIAMIIVCAIGLGLAPLAWIRERHRPLAGAGAALCCAALFWQYLLIGIVVGVAIAVILLLLSALG
jgi:hypothetical protein